MGPFEISKVTIGEWESTDGLRTLGEIDEMHDVKSDWPIVPRILLSNDMYSTSLSIVNRVLQRIVERRVSQIRAMACPNKRVSHLILNGKNYRTRKKNSKRAMKIILGGF